MLIIKCVGDQEALDHLSLDADHVVSPKSFRVSVMIEQGVVSCKGVTDQTFSADSSIIVCPAEKTVSQLMMKMFDTFQAVPNHYHCCEADVSWWCQLMSAPDKTIRTSSSWNFEIFFRTHEMYTLFNFNNTFLRSDLNHDNLGPDGVLSPFISIYKEGKHFYLKEIIVNGRQWSWNLKLFTDK